MVHTWEISDLERLESNGFINLVRWRCLTNKGKYFTKKAGEFTLQGNPSDPGFIPFEDVTEEIAQGWVTSNVDKPYYENLNAESINEFEDADNALPISSGLPWS
jgi:hypothetical protein